MQSIQNYVQQVIAEILNHAPFKLMAASRTDSGVHAAGQVLKLELPRDINPEKLKQGMNSKLPSDIKVKECAYSDKKFNPNKDALAKEYHYYFSRRRGENPLLSDIIYFKNEELDIALMKTACSKIIGTHDFRFFSSSKESDINTIRTITECSIQRAKLSPFHEEIFYLKIKGDGFLKYMIRFLMGTLFDVGSGQTTLKELETLFTVNNCKIKRKKAAPHGLHLIEIFYS